MGLTMSRGAGGIRRTLLIGAFLLHGCRPPVPPEPLTVHAIDGAAEAEDAGRFRPATTRPAQRVSGPLVLPPRPSPPEPDDRGCVYDWEAEEFEAVASSWETEALAIDVARRGWERVTDRRYVVDDRDLQDVARVEGTRLVGNDGQHWARIGKRTACGYNTAKEIYRDTNGDLFKLSWFSCIASEPVRVCGAQRVGGCPRETNEPDEIVYARIGAQNRVLRGRHSVTVDAGACSVLVWDEQGEPPP